MKMKKKRVKKGNKREGRKMEDARHDLHITQRLARR